MSARTPECWASDPNAEALRIEVTPGQSLMLPHDQFMFAELTGSGIEQNIKLVYAAHEVSIRGHYLRRIVSAMERIELSLLAAVPSSHQNLIPEGQPVVLEITVKEASAYRKQPGGA